MKQIFLFAFTLFAFQSFAQVAPTYDHMRLRSSLRIGATNSTAATGIDNAMPGSPTTHLITSKGVFDWFTGTVVFAGDVTGPYNNLQLGTGVVGANELENVGTAGSCTNCNLTIDAKGRVTAKANGSGGSGGGSLPAGQMGFGSADGASITSDTTNKFNPTTKTQRISNVGNKGYTEINGKGVVINPDTTLDFQSFFHINKGRNSPYTYAPWDMNVSYGSQGGGGPYPYLDYVWTEGPNSGGNGTPIEANKPMFQKTIETGWINFDTPYGEIIEAFKQPDSTAVRLSMWTIRYNSPLYPSAIKDFNYFLALDKFYLKSPVSTGGASQYFSVSRNRVDGSAEMSLQTSPTSQLYFNGSTAGSQSDFAIGATGATNKFLTFSGFNTIVFNPSSGIPRFFSGNGFTYQANNTTGAQHTFDNNVGATTIPILRVINSGNGTTTLSVHGNGGVAIGAATPATTAVLDISSTTKVMYPPRMTNSQRDAISGITAGGTIFCTDCTATDASTGVMQTYNGSTWKNNW